MNEGESFWREIMKEFSEGIPHVTIVGKPSQSKMEQMQEAEMNFIEDRIQRMGEAGLNQSRRRLKEAKDMNEASNKAR